MFSLAFQEIRGTFKFEKHWARSMWAFKVDCFFCLFGIAVNSVLFFFFSSNEISGRCPYVKCIRAEPFWLMEGPDPPTQTLSLIMHTPQGRTGLVGL